MEGHMHNNREGGGGEDSIYAAIISELMTVGGE